MAPVLEGLRVLDLSWGVAGPVTTMLMSDYGADVIKVEPPGGDPFRSYPGSLVWNRGKKSVVLDLKQERAAAAFHELVQTADVLVESFRPGATERLGISYDQLHAENPRLVYCSITGYGRHSQASGRPAYDGLVQARSGIQNEQAGHRPGPVYLYIPPAQLRRHVPRLLRHSRGAARAGGHRHGSVGRNLVDTGRDLLPIDAVDPH